MTTTTTEPAPDGWTADDSTFAARLALIRLRMGWGNIAEAARQCGLTKEGWRNWEKDGREPHRLPTIAAQISGATGCDYLWLVHGPGLSERTHNGRYGLGTRVVATVRPAPTVGDPVRPVRQTRPSLRSSRTIIRSAA